MTPNRSTLVLLGLLTWLGCSTKAQSDGSGFGDDTTGGESDSSGEASGDGDSTETETATMTANGDGDGDSTGDGDGDGDSSETGDGDSAADVTESASGDGDGDTAETGGDGECPPDDDYQNWEMIPIITAIRDEQGTCTFGEVEHECGMTSQLDSTCGDQGGEVSCESSWEYGYFRINDDESVSIAYDSTCRGFAGFSPCTGDVDDPTPIEDIPIECLCLCDDGNPLLP